MKNFITLLTFLILSFNVKSEVYPEQIFLIGNITNWFEDYCINMSDTPGVYTTTLPINGDFKFRLNQSWDINTNYGGGTIVSNEYSGTAHLEKNGSNLYIPGPLKLYNITVNLNNNTCRWEAVEYSPNEVLYKSNYCGEWKPLTKIEDENFLYEAEVNRESNNNDVDLYFKIRNEESEYYLTSTDNGLLKSKHLVYEGNFVLCEKEDEIVPFHFDFNNMYNPIILDLASQTIFSGKKEADCLYNLQLVDMNGRYFQMSWDYPRILYRSEPMSDDDIFVGYFYLPSNPKFQIVTDNLDDGTCRITPNQNSEFLRVDEDRVSGTFKVNGEKYWNLNNWPSGLTKVTVYQYSHTVTFELIESDETYTDWEFLGTTQIEDSFVKERLYDFIEKSYSAFGINKTVENWMNTYSRKNKNNPQHSQLLIANFLGLDNLVVDMDCDIFHGTVKGIQSSIPMSKDRDWYSQSSYYFINCYNVWHEPTNNKIKMDFWLSLGYDGIYGYSFNNIEINDAYEESTDDFRFQYVSGGVKSDDRCVEYKLNLSGDISHIKYLYYHQDEKVSLLEAMKEIIQNDSKAILTSENVSIDFYKGAGRYYFVPLAFNAQDEYIGVFKFFVLNSNLAPEGNWIPYGKGTWHHTYPLYWAEETDFSFSDEELKWEVEIEKLDDDNREVFRIVTPYNKNVPFYEKVKTFLDESGYINTSNWIDDSDSYWFVCDISDPENALVMPRLNGTYCSDIMDNWFNKQTGKAYWEDNRLTIKCQGNPLEYVIDFPKNSYSSPIINNASDGEEEYYNLQGIKISNPSKGIYIRKIGNKIDKVSL